MKTVIETKNEMILAFKNLEITENSQITVDIFDGPMACYGFRSGYWPIKVNDIKFLFYFSVPSVCELDEQKRRLIERVKNSLMQISSGETYTDSDGKEHYKYSPTCKRI